MLEVAGFLDRNVQGSRHRFSEVLGSISMFSWRSWCVYAKENKGGVRLRRSERMAEVVGGGGDGVGLTTFFFILNDMEIPIFLQSGLK